ncbi:MAG: arabinan endo-1,5-alpha-L-arabinosidase [Deltaproteobacteria bacterium]|nr:arabinan endo-1,5-alpha-L-arabinosidase [Deltaproteobacteria bacterium]
MANSGRGAVVLCLGLAAVLGACHTSPDTVASSYGDYDPEQPPVVLPLEGAIGLSDPCLFRWHGTYWVFSSGPGIAIASSQDLVTFRDGAPLFAQNPAWIAQSLPQVTDLWSPDVRAFGGVIHLYYAASTFGSGRSCIGHATTTDLKLPFVDQGSVVCSNLGGDVDEFDAIDPVLFLDAPDDPWLVFGSYGAGIQLIALDGNGQRRDAEMHALAVRSPDNPAIQAPFLYRWRDTYYLFVSFDTCCIGVSSTHNIRVGRSARLLGPYVDRDGVPMLEGGGTLVLASDARYKGPGSNMVLDDGGQRLNVYHAYDSERQGAPVLRMATLFFDNDGWPVTAGP